MKSKGAKQLIVSLDLKGSKNKTTLPHKIEVGNNRAMRRLKAKLVKQGKEVKDTP